MSASTLYQVFLEKWFRNKHVTDLDLIRAYQDSPNPCQDYKNKLVSGALRRTKYIFAEYLYSQGAIADPNIFCEHGPMSHILRYSLGHSSFRGYVLTSNIDWVYTFIRIINTDTYLDIFVEVIHTVGIDTWNNKRKCYVIDADNGTVDRLIQLHRYNTVKRLIELGIVIPNAKSITLLCENPPRDNPMAFAECIFVTMNSAKLPKNVRLREWRQHFLFFHKSARQRRTLREMALIKCAKAGVPCCIPDSTPISWHLRQDLYRIEKCKRLLNGI